MRVVCKSETGKIISMNLGKYLLIEKIQKCRLYTMESQYSNKLTL